MAAPAAGRDLSAVRLAVVIALITGLMAIVATVGADARWLAALGRIIVAQRSIPDGIPFAAAPTSHWSNTLVVAELTFDGLERAFGDRGLLVAQLVAVALAMTVLARDARAGGANSFGTASALALVAIGSLGSLAVARVQLFSLVLFPLLVALLRSQARAPSRRLYLALVLLAVWSNLHGAALLGLAVLWAYLALSRFRQERWTAVAVAVLAPLAICLTPAGIDTVDYYRGLLTNVAAQRGVGLWSPLSTGPLDVLMVAVALALLFRMRRARPPLWELVVIAGLAILTIKAGRDGVWLLFFLAPLAAHSSRAVRREWNGLLPIAAVAALALLVLGLARTPTRATVGPALVARAITLAHGTPVLAEAIAAEQVALAGGRIWVGDPLDAFPRRIQGLYLDWLAGDPDGRAVLANPRIEVVLVSPGSAALTLTAADSAFIRVAGDKAAVLFVRRSAAKSLRGGSAGAAAG